MKGYGSASAPAAMSELNQSRIVQYLHRNGVCSRAQIAKGLGLTAPAITKLVARLIEPGIISETGNLGGRGHRRSIGLRLNASSHLVIGVKFARSLVQIGVFDLSGNLMGMQELPPVGDGDVQQAVETVKKDVRALIDEDPRITGVGMAVPGPYLREEGSIALVTGMQGWRGVNFKREFSRAFEVPTFIEQDARAGALAQSLFDPRIDKPDIAYYLVGEGVGLGVLDGGSLLNGSQGAATEIGHISISQEGPTCECGNVGCLECYCSAVALHHTLVSPAHAGHYPGFRGLTHSQACERLFAMAEDGDGESQALVADLARYVGYGCVTIVNAYNPSQIVIGDIMARAGRPLLDTVRALVEARTIPQVGGRTQILLSSLPVDATLTGAAAVAANQFLLHPAAFVGRARREPPDTGRRPAPVRADQARQRRGQAGAGLRTGLQTAKVVGQVTENDSKQKEG